MRKQMEDVLSKLDILKDAVEIYAKVYCKDEEQKNKLVGLYNEFLTEFKKIVDERGDV